MANIKLDGKRLKAFALRSKGRQKFPHLSFMFNIGLEMLARAIRQAKETKCIEREKKGFSTNGMVLYVQYAKE